MNSFLIVLLITSTAFAEGSLQDQVKKAEIQFEICEPSVEALFEKLQLAREDSKTKDVFYYDTENLSLIQQNTVIKISQTEVQNQTTVKVKDIAENAIPWKFLNGQDFKCENDIYLDLSRVSCGINSTSTDDQNVLNSPQINFMRLMNIKVPNRDQLKTFGPVETTEFSYQKADYKLVIEASSVHENLAAIELSARVDRKQASKTQNEIAALLKQSNVILCPDQQGKIKRIFKWLQAP